MWCFNHADLKGSIPSRDSKADEGTPLLLARDDDDEKPLAVHRLHSISCCSIAVLSLLVLSITYFVLYTSNPGSTIELEHLSKIYLSSTKYQRYVRVSGGSSSADSLNHKLVLTEDIPWLHGSTFEVYNSNSSLNKCFRLRTAWKRWLRIDAQTDVLKADAESQWDGTLFEAISYSTFQSGTYRTDDDSHQLMVFKQCEGDKLLEVVEHAKAEDELTITDASDRPLQVVLRSFQKLLSAEYVYNHPSRLDDRQFSYLRYSGVKLFSVKSFSPFQRSDLGSVFKVTKVKHMRGVNLGGWFIPEIWMNPDFSSWTGLGWAGSLCRVVKFDSIEAERRMETHLSSWITEEDFSQIASFGFDSVRLPVGYWNLVPDPYHKFVPRDVALSHRYIDWTFDMADKYGLTVLLDLHGVPGSQNGNDHSGCNNGTSWLEKQENIDLYFETISFMAQRYSSRASLVGFELANEPSDRYMSMRRDQLIGVYNQAYQIVRKHCRECHVVFNELYEVAYSDWTTHMVEPDYYNVVMDLHLYNWQAPYTYVNASEHIANAVAWGGLIDDLTQHHPVVVGEWCYSTGIFHQVGQTYVDACVHSFRRASGWYLWNWKVQADIPFAEWNVQLQSNTPNGLRSTYDTD